MKKVVFFIFKSNEGHESVIATSETNGSDAYQKMKELTTLSFSLIKCEDAPFLPSTGYLFKRIILAAQNGPVVIFNDILPF